MNEPTNETAFPRTTEMMRKIVGGNGWHISATYMTGHANTLESELTAKDREIETLVEQQEFFENAFEHAYKTVTGNDIEWSSEFGCHEAVIEISEVLGGKDREIERLKQDRLNAEASCATANERIQNLTVENAELKSELDGAHKHNDSDLPIDELLAGISDAVMDIKPDGESDSAGTLLERVKACADLVSGMVKENAELRADKERLKGLLEEYGAHTPICAAIGFEHVNSDKCDCGWVATRKAIAARASERKPCKRFIWNKSDGYCFHCGRHRREHKFNDSGNRIDHEAENNPLHQHYIVQR